jgi:hypothetical protein
LREAVQSYGIGAVDAHVLLDPLQLPADVIHAFSIRARWMSMPIYQHFGQIRRRTGGTGVIALAGATRVGHGLLCAAVGRGADQDMVGLRGARVTPLDARRWRHLLKLGR